MSEKIIDHKMIINGDYVNSVSNQKIGIECPANKQLFATVPRGIKEDVDIAVKSSLIAFQSWSKVNPKERGKILLDIANDIDDQKEEIAKIIAKETGNAIRTQARPEINLVVDIFRYFGGLSSELKGETIPLGEHVLSYTRREPLGVVGAIIPWNAPVMLAACKIAPSLCTGNTLVMKAAEDAPLAVLKVAEICQKHIPPGVFNLITGTGSECGEPLAYHPDISKLSFTGSTAVGKLIMRAAAERVLPVSLELGGKSPSIVYPDVNEDWTVDGIIGAMRFTRQSQSCTAGSRLFLHKRIFDSFIEQLANKLDKLIIGDPLDDKTDMGTIINNKQYTKVCDYIKDGLDNKETEIICGGLPPKEGPLSEGYFTIPTIFRNKSNEWRLAKEEIFGPVLVAIPWEDENEVIKMANQSHYGLAAYVWTRDITRGINAAHAIESGWVQVNQGLGQVPGHSYGGYKQSGLGREFSLEGMLDSFTQRKNISINLNTPAKEL
ncbi:MAG: aldehyde dehydrogenase family protein [Rhizobiales bacterium]|nr:aldehyde dehydrogenase family protein [Hyphomicrobiales bacterium]MBL6770828.1 aldehyde dehydrogenase family protein [Hyphomicrobiales bacterium]